MLTKDTIKICVVGLGYVGLPLALLFSSKFKTFGYDINPARVKELRSGHDSRLEADDRMMQEAIASGRLVLTSELNEIKECSFFVIAVQTPVDNFSKPDLTPLLGASEIVGKVLSKGNVVVYESTVYPGVTEDKCVPVLQKTSGLVFNEDFFCGYSPERVNPGDRLHTVETICKVTSGSTPEAAELIDSVYREVLVNGTHKASSIKVAEAAKVIENAQRDLNIAFFNEIAIILNSLGIDTHDVIEAASSKWNFVKMKPGLVGGHCISVDPYYLIEKAKEYGLDPRLMVSARAVNEGMAPYVAKETVEMMIRKGVTLKDASVLILGFTFKENCPDIRNTKVIDIYNTLRQYSLDVVIADPWADPELAGCTYGVKIAQYSPEKLSGKFDAVILAVAHNQFAGVNIRQFLKNSAEGVVYDVKGVLPAGLYDERL